MPVRGKTKKEIVCEFRTSEIMEAARTVFAKKGFHDATVDEIAAAVGLAKGTLYLYYKSKREIYVEALKFGLASLTKELTRQVDAASSVEEKLRTLIAARLGYFEANRDFFKIYYYELGQIPLAPPTKSEKAFLDLYFEQAKLIESVLKEGIRQKVLRTINTEMISFAIADLVRGVVTQRILGWTSHPLQDDVRFVFDLIWKGIQAS